MSWGSSCDIMLETEEVSTHLCLCHSSVIAHEASACTAEYLAEVSPPCRVWRVCFDPEVWEQLAMHWCVDTIGHCERSGKDEGVPLHHQKLQTVLSTVIFTALSGDTA